MTTNKTKGRRIKPKKIIFSSLFIASLVFIMVSISFSWFMGVKDATVSGISVSAAEANNLEIRNQDGEWVKELIMTADEDFRFQAVCGNGNTFYSPIMELVEIGYSEEYGYSDYVVTGTELIVETDLPAYVLTCDFSARMESGSPLYLSNSFVRKGTSSDPKEYASSAVRVAVMVQDGEVYRTVLIWIPDVTVLQFTEDGQVNTDSESARTETSVLFMDETGEDISVMIEGESGSRVIDGITYVWGEITDPCYVAEMKYGEECNLRIVIWIDGKDADCRNALLSGEVFVQMNLTATKDATEVTTAGSLE